MQKTQAKEFFCLTEKDVSFCLVTFAHAHCWPQPGQNVQQLSCCSWSLWHLRKSQIDATKMLLQPSYIPGRRSAKLFSSSHAPLCVRDTCYAAGSGGSAVLPHCSLKQWQLLSGVQWSRLRLSVRSGLRRNGSELWRQRKKVPHKKLQWPCSHLCRLLWHRGCQAQLQQLSWVGNARQPANVLGGSTPVGRPLQHPHRPALQDFVSPKRTHGKSAALQSIAALPAAGSHTAQGRRAEWLQHVPWGIAVALLSTPDIPVHALDGSSARGMYPHCRAQPPQQGALRGWRRRRRSRRGGTRAHSGGGCPRRAPLLDIRTDSHRAGQCQQLGRCPGCQQLARGPWTHRAALCALLDEHSHSRA